MTADLYFDLMSKNERAILAVHTAVHAFLALYIQYRATVYTYIPDTVSDNAVPHNTFLQMYAT